MARTHDPCKNTQDSGKSTEPTTPVDPGPVASKPTSKTVCKNKRSHDENNTAIVEQLVAMIKRAKTVSTKTKHSQDTEDITILTYEQPSGPGPTKKAKMTVTKSQKSIETPATQSPTQQSARNKTQAPTVTQKRKWRSKAEMEADAAKVEEDRQQKEELIKEKNLAMEQMNVNENNNRKATAAQTIQKFSDLEHDLQLDGEEFLGYNEVSGSEDGSDSDEEPVNNARILKVSWF